MSMYYQPKHPNRDRTRQTNDPAIWQPQAGKSSYASKAPGSLFFECEPGLNHLEVFQVPTYSWEAFLEACKLVAKEIITSKRL